MADGGVLPPPPPPSSPGGAGAVKRHNVYRQLPAFATQVLALLVHPTGPNWAPVQAFPASQPATSHSSHGAGAGSAAAVSSAAASSCSAGLPTGRPIPRAPLPCAHAAEHLRVSIAWPQTFSADAAPAGTTYC